MCAPDEPPDPVIRSHLLGMVADVTPLLVTVVDGVVVVVIVLVALVVMVVIVVVVGEVLFVVKEVVVEVWWWWWWWSLTAPTINFTHSSGLRRANEAPRASKKAWTGRVITWGW